MPANPTRIRAERAQRRQAPARERPQGETARSVTVDHDRETRALYLLERDFYGFPLDGDVRARSARDVERSTSSR